VANELIRPIDADTARAIEEAAKTAGKAVDAAVKAGEYGGGVLGDLPHHTVGILRDWVVHKRARAAHATSHMAVTGGDCRR
jgi:hypothetical protein